MKLISTSLLLLIAFFSNSVFSAERDGIYFGGSICQSNIDVSDDELGVYGEYVYIDKFTTGFKLLGGYYYGLSPSIDLGFEVDYREFGIIDSYESQFYDDTSDENYVVVENAYQEYATVTHYRQDISAFNFYGMLAYNLGKMGFFGKLGASFNDSDVDNAGGNLFHSDFSYTYGIGAKFQLGSVAIRSEYEVIDFNSEGANFMYMFSVGGTVTF